MIIGPIVAAATVAARAVGTMMPGDWLDGERRSSSHRDRYRPPSPGNQYQYPYREDAIDAQARELAEDRYRPPSPGNQYSFREDDIDAQARELAEFAARSPPPIDAEILGKAVAAPTAPAPARSRRRPPPPLPDTDDPSVLLGLGPAATYDDARRAYKRCAKLYHPDVIATPDATADERAAAGDDFARINAAFDLLKRRERAEVFEYSAYDNGERVTRSVVVPDGDPTFVDYSRIAEVGEYRRRHPRERQWHERDGDGRYQRPRRRHGFEGDEANRDGYSHHFRTRGRAFRNDHGYGHVPSNEQQMFAGRDGGGGDRGRARGRDVGMGPGPSPAQGYPPRTRRRFEAETKQGYPYKDRLSFEGPGYDAAACARSDGNRVPDYHPREQSQKWWQGDPDLDNFAP